MCRCVCALISWCCGMSTSSPKCLRKLSPRMGFCTSAMMKIHGSDRRSPRLRVRERFLYVRMGVLVMRVRFSDECRLSAEEMALTSDPVSTKKRVCVVRSLRQQRGGPETPVAASIRPGSFSNCTGPCTCGTCHRTWCGTSRGVFGRRVRGWTLRVTGFGPAVLAGSCCQRCNEVSQACDFFPELVDFGGVSAGVGDSRDSGCGHLHNFFSNVSKFVENH